MKFLMVSVILITGVLLAGCSATDYSKPWFKGTAVNLVCKIPYYHTSSCNSLNVSSDGNKIEAIYFNNGVSKIINSSSCSKASDVYNFKTICLVEDLDGVEWDILPIGSSF